MHRPLWRSPFWSIAKSLSELKLHEHGRINVAVKLEFSHALTTSLGQYGAKSSTNSMQKQIVGALRMGERGRASNLLSNFCNENNSLRVADFLDILEYCARSPDPLFVMEMWKMIEEKEICLDNKCHMLIMQALCKGGYLEEASNLIHFLGESSSTPPNLCVYNYVLGACTKVQNLVHANLCLELMGSRVVGKNEITYTQLLKLAVWQKNLSAVHEIWKDYIKHYSLSILPLQKFIWSFSVLRDIKSAYGTLQRMIALAMRGKLCMKESYNRRLQSTRLDIPVLSSSHVQSEEGDLEEIEHDVGLKIDSSTCNPKQNIIFNIPMEEAETSNVCMTNNFKTRPAMKVLKWSFSDVIHACAQTRNGGLAEQLMLQVQSLGLRPSRYMYDSLIKAVVSERGFSYGIKLLKLMQETNLKPYNTTLARVSIECSKALELGLSEALLEQISKFPYAGPFNVFLAACDATDQPERAIKMLAKMKQLNIRPNIRTFMLLFSLFGNVNAPYEKGNILSQADSAKRIKAIEMDMAKNSVQHNPLSMNYLLKALGAEGGIRELIQYLHAAENLFCHYYIYITPIYNTALRFLVQARETHTAVQIFKNMKSTGYPTSDATYNIMIECCNVTACFRSASALVAMMIRDGYLPNAMTYTTLIKILLKYEDYDKALYLLDQARAEGFQPDIVLYNTILQRASEKERMDVIEYIIEQMHRDKIQPDTSTCHHVFSGYVNQMDRQMEKGKSSPPSIALEALQVLTIRMLEKDVDIQEKRTEFEDLILAEDMEVESRILQFFKDSKEEAAVGLLQLRWCAMLGFPISWSPKQSSWARRLSANYDAIKRTG